MAALEGEAMSYRNRNMEIGREFLSCAKKWLMPDWGTPPVSGIAGKRGKLGSDWEQKKK